MPFKVLDGVDAVLGAAVAASTPDFFTVLGFELEDDDVV